MSGLPSRKVLIYGGLIVLLLAANLFRLSGSGTPETAQAVERSAASRIRVPELEVAASGAAQVGKRDVFRAIEKAVPKPVAVAPVAPQPEPARPDPTEIAIEQARKQLDSVRLIGVVASGEGALAVFELDGNTLSRVVGDEIVSGFRLDRISQSEIRARHERLGLVAILSLGGVRPMQITRVQ